MWLQEVRGEWLQEVRVWVVAGGEGVGGCRR